VTILSIKKLGNLLKMVNFIWATLLANCSKSLTSPTLLQSLSDGSANGAFVDTGNKGKTCPCYHVNKNQTGRTSNIFLSRTIRISKLATSKCNSESFTTWTTSFRWHYRWNHAKLSTK